jgi:hypothetical protein
MKRFTLNNVEYVLAREQAGRDVECVEVSTGLIRWIPRTHIAGEVNHEKYMVPDMVPLPYRDPKFLMDLRESRRLLLDKVKRTRAKKTDPDAPKISKARSPRGTAKLNETIAAVVPAHLQALVAMAMAGKKKK